MVGRRAALLEPELGNWVPLSFQREPGVVGTWLAAVDCMREEANFFEMLVVMSFAGGRCSSEARGRAVVALSYSENFGTLELAPRVWEQAPLFENPGENPMLALGLS